MKSRTSGSNSRPRRSSSKRRRSSSGSSSKPRISLSPTAKAIGAATAGAIAGGLIVTAIAKRRKPTIMKTAEKLKDWVEDHKPAKRLKEWVEDRRRKSRRESITKNPVVKTLMKGIAKSASRALEEVA